MSLPFSILTAMEFAVDMAMDLTIFQMLAQHTLQVVHLAPQKLLALPLAPAAVVVAEEELQTQPQPTTVLLKEITLAMSTSNVYKLEVSITTLETTEVMATSPL